MNVKKNKTLISAVILIFVLILIISLLVFFWPKSEINFFEIGLLGKDKLAKDFFPDNNSTITVGTQIDWHIYIHNHMGSHQDVIIKVKLVNLASSLPGDLEQIPFPSDSFFEIPLLLSVDETQLIPFSWSILEVDYQNDVTIIKNILVNDQTISLEDSSSQNSSFRMIFELWIYNQSSQIYEFGWENGFDVSSASVNMAFRIS